MGRLIRNNKGAALVFVMMVLVVVSIMIAIVANIAQANITQAGAQEDSMEAYYIARSGVELAYEVLLTTTPSLLDTFVADPGTVLEQNGVDFETGTADIRITSNGSGDSQKILIESTGTLADDGMSRTVSLEFYINYSENPQMTWSR